MITPAVAVCLVYIEQMKRISGYALFVFLHSDFVINLSLYCICLLSLCQMLLRVSIAEI